MRGKRTEFRVIRHVKTSVRDKKCVSLASGIDKPADIWKQFFSARHVELPAWQHEVSLRVHAP
jgi:hypothetical protein